MQPKLRLLVMTVSVILFSFVRTSVFGQATVHTDKDDYPPGATVIISGSGFQSGETVILQVTHVGDDGDNDVSGAHAPWNVVADASGNIYSIWTVPPDQDELGATLKLTADGQGSGLHAEWIFTDATQTQILGLTPSTGTCGSTITVSCTLQQKSQGNTYIALPDQTVVFTLGSNTASATTDANGLASTSIVVPAGATQLKADFTGTGGSGFSSSPTATLSFTPTSITPTLNISANNASPICSAIPIARFFRSRLIRSVPVFIRTLPSAWRSRSTTRKPRAIENWKRCWTSGAERISRTT